MSSTPTRRLLRSVTVALAVALAAGACSSTGSKSGSSQATDKAGGNQISAYPAGFRTSGPANTPAPRPLKSNQSLKVGIPSKLELEVPALLAQAKGEFAKENLTVQFVTDTVPNLLTLLGQNKVDLVYAGPQAIVFNELRKGVPIRWVSGVASFSPGGGTYVSTKYGSSASGFNPAVLKGKRIAVNPGGLAAPSEFGLYQLLTKGGLKAGDVTMIPFQSISAMVQAMNSGAVASGNVGPPFDAALTPGKFFVAYHYPGAVLAGYFATTQLLNQHRDAGIAFFRALERTVNTYLTGDYHKDRAVMSEIASLLGTTPAKLELAPSIPFDFNVPAQSVTGVQQMYQSVPGTLAYSGLVAPKEIVDLSLVVDAADGK